jgi:hypothetical protein
MSAEDNFSTADVNAQKTRVAFMRREIILPP